MRRRIAVAGDTLDGGGEIADYQQALGFRARGHKVALIGGMARAAPAYLHRPQGGVIDGLLCNR
jgi:hypothetical protein